MKLNINNEQGVEFLHFIFERELKPPFRKGEKGVYDFYTCYNRDDDYIGWLDSDKHFAVRDPFWLNIKYKVCQVFGFSYENRDWWYAIKPHLTSWLEDRLNVELDNIWKI